MILHIPEDGRYLHDAIYSLGVLMNLINALGYLDKWHLKRWEAE